MFNLNQLFRLMGLFVVGLMVLRAGGVSAQAALTSFGTRVPTSDEIKKAFEPAPKSDKLMSMGMLPTPVKKSIDMNLLFASGSAEIAPTSKAQLNALGEFLQGAQLGAEEFVIEGHTDSTGVQELNRTLSGKRAAAVKQYLVREHKIQPNVIKTTGRGSEVPKDAANPTAGVNRRVEFSMMVRE